MKLSRLEPDQQKEAATLLAAKEIGTVEEYTAKAGGRKPAGTGLENMEKTDREPEIRKRDPEETANGKETEDMVSQGTTLKCAAGSEKGQQDGQGDSGEGDKPPAPAFSVMDAQQESDLHGRKSTSFRDLVAELKDPDKDCSGTPESFLEEYAAFVRKFHREIGWYDDPYYDTVYPYLDGGQLASLKEMTRAICSAAEGILQKVERMAKK
ncbi:MAG: hypothetical protein NC420_07160 [Eubacterium sp.]|nr:hypothetical protein [Eubacterium sp.]